MKSGLFEVLLLQTERGVHLLIDPPRLLLQQELWSTKILARAVRGTAQAKITSVARTFLILRIGAPGNNEGGVGGGHTTERYPQIELL